MAKTYEARLSEPDQGFISGQEYDDGQIVSYLAVALKNMSAIETIDSSAAIPKSSISWVIVTMFVFSSLLVVNYLRPPDNRQLEEWGFVAAIDLSTIGSVHALHHEGHEIDVVVTHPLTNMWAYLRRDRTSRPDNAPWTVPGHIDGLLTNQHMGIR